MIEWLMERRYGAPYSEKWWSRRHEYLHGRMVELACPLCPDAAGLLAEMRAGTARAMSYNDFRAAIEEGATS